MNAALETAVLPRAMAGHNRLMDSATPRRLTCAHCGTPFDCGLGGDCWCAAEPFRLPMPIAAPKPTTKPAPKSTPKSGAVEDCLCPACLRAAAAAEQDIH
jgi:hypothetical protein